MNESKQQSVIDAISSIGILPMYIDGDIVVMKKILDICHSVNISVFEVLNRKTNSFELFLQLKDYVETYLPGMKLCAGTVTTLEAARNYIDAGASMIIAPNLDAEIGRFCLDKGVEWLPGVTTVSEIYEAVKIGTSSVKLFPAELSSPKFISTVKSLLPTIKIVASGGVRSDRNSLDAWFGNGAAAVGLGSGIFKEITPTSDTTAVRATLSENIETIRKVRSE